VEKVVCGSVVMRYVSIWHDPSPLRFRRPQPESQGPWAPAPLRQHNGDPREVRAWGAASGQRSAKGRQRQSEGEGEKGQASL
jgi:hypothetical protein